MKQLKVSNKKTKKGMIYKLGKIKKTSPLVARFRFGSTRVRTADPSD